MKCLVNIFFDTDLKFKIESYGSKYSTRSADVSKNWNAEKLGFHVEVLEAGAFACPYHLHHHEEELLLALKGSVMVRQEGEYFEVKEGDLVFFKAQVAHQIFNHTNQPFRFLALSSQDLDEICDFPDSRKRWDRRLKKMTQEGIETDNYWKDEQNPDQNWPSSIIHRKPALSDQRPTLTTERLILRPFSMADASRVQELAGHKLVAETTATIPHPYPDGVSESWIANHAEWYRKGAAVQFAIALKSTGDLIGCIDLGISKPHQRAELGYWIGVDFWNSGYCSEAAKAIVKYGMEMLNLNKITSRHLTSNPASGRVMMKAGLKKEGVLRKEFQKNNQFHDLEVYGLLQSEYAK